MSQAALTFPLVTRRRVSGLPFGAMRSSRRGPGIDLAGSRPYRPGDDYRLIDRHASARLSSLSGSDELIVREHLTEEAAAIVVVADRRPSMALFPDELPWLSKPRAVSAAVDMIGESARRARCPVETLPAGPFDAPEDTLERPLSTLAERERPVRPGSFVFLLSDFIELPPDETWVEALGHRWDLVPVIVQDPVWEQSFPDVSGTLLPIADPATGRLARVRLSRAEVEARRSLNEARLRAVTGLFDSLGLDWVLLGTSDPSEIVAEFVAWSAARQAGAGAR